MLYVYSSSFHQNFKISKLMKIKKNEEDQRLFQQKTLLGKSVLLLNLRMLFSFFFLQTKIFLQFFNNNKKKNTSLNFNFKSYQNKQILQICY